MSRFFVLILAVSLLSCGYSFSGSGSVLPTSIKTVYIRPVVNNTTESGLGLMLTDALKDRFDRYGTLSVVESEYQADAVLDTEVIDVKRDTRSVTSGTDTALQVETTIQVKSELNSSAGLKLWSVPRMSISRTYGAAEEAVVTSSAAFASSGLNSDDLSNLNSREIARGQEQQVMELMTENLSKKIYQSAVLPEF